MPSPKPISKEQILAAMSQTLSNKAAARYLHVSYTHYKRWAKTYDATEDGYNSLFDQQLNQAGKGIPKFLRADGPEPALLDIIEGRIDASSFSPDKLKYRLITEGYLKEECSVCDFHERRVSDYKIPLLLNFKDNNKNNYRKENIELLCYNHYFLQVGDIFSDKQIKGIEDHVPTYQSEVEWELSDYQKEQMESLGLGGPQDDNDDPYSLVSRR
tara:strand:+ start:190 stop:831 length:642 start_codon:yes stop_codon:yes gene_type:complete